MPNYDPPPYQEPSFKDRIAHRLAREERKITRVHDEEANKQIVRREDRRCRYPDCPWCARYRPKYFEVAHVVQAKGMGGDPSGIRSQPEDMILLCGFAHAHQEAHDIDIVTLTERGTRGPCEFWRRGEDQQMFLVARETAPFEYERD